MGPGGGGGGGGLPGGLGGLGGLLKGGGGMMAILLLLAVVFLPKILGGAQQAAAPATQVDTADVTDGTCNDENEQVLCGAVVDVQQYWTKALPKYFGTDYQVAKTVFFSDATNTGCGQGSAQMGPFYCPLDNKVYFDLTFLPALEKQLIGKSTDLAQQYIVAHEYGHHVQNLLGTSDQVRQAQQNDPRRANQYSVALELQADCFAGVWVGDIAARGLLDNSNEINEALDAAAGVGDDAIQIKTQGRSDPESFTHGSSEQRQTWFTRGFNTRDPRECNTFNEVI
jgi:predicted metalloprotease